MKVLNWIILGLVVAMTTWLIYRTREVEPRVDTSIDLNWRFTLGDPNGASLPKYNDSEWRFLSLPHDWIIEQKAAKHNPSGTATGFSAEGIAWYRKSIDLSEFSNKEQFYLLFEGVMRNADIFFNGSHLGRHDYAYSSFYYDISELVRQDTLNVIAVRTDCSKLPVDNRYSGGGIYRHVRLIATNSVHMQPWGEAVSSVIEDDGRARLDISLELENRSRKNRRFEIWYDIVGPGGNLVAEGRSSEYLLRQSSRRVSRSFTIADPLLWSPETPDQYTVHFHLMDKNKKLDHGSIHHGIRTAEFDPDRGFLLNGEKYVLKGVCLQNEGGEQGAAIPLESWKKRLELLKKLEVNALRLAHNPHAPEVLDLCDQLGFLVIDEMYDKLGQSWKRAAGEFSMEESWKQDLRNLIRRDRNHASVILWSLGNESIEKRNIHGEGIAWDRRIKELVYSIDTTRMVTAGLNPDRDNGFMKLAGQFIPADTDYLAESDASSDPGLRKDMLETGGFVKPYAWYIASRYRNDPLVKLTVKDSRRADSQDNLLSRQTSWAGGVLVDHWSFLEDKREKDLVVFTNCSRVEIELNNRLIHKLKRDAFSDGVIKASVPYEKGELVAHAIYMDEEGQLKRVSDTLSSSLAPYALAMNTEQGKEEPGKISSADQEDLEEISPGGSSSKKKRKGKQLLILQAGSEPDDLIMSSDSEGLKPSKTKK